MTLEDFHRMPEAEKVRRENEITKKLEPQKPDTITKSGGQKKSTYTAESAKR